MARVIKAFRDRVTWEAYGPGDEYRGGRADELAAAGYVEPPAPEAAPVRGRSRKTKDRG